VKEEARRWRMLMTTMIVVVGHDDGDKQHSTKKCGVALTSTVVVVVANSG
jgi:hypothetical protein